MDLAIKLGIVASDPISTSRGGSSRCKDPKLKITASVESIVSNEQQSEDKTPEGLEEDQVTLESQSETSNASGAAADGGEQGTSSNIESELEKLKDELARAKEQSLRAAAEAQNIRRRAEQDVEKAHKYGLEKFVGDIVPVADNLERAVEAASAEGADMKAVIEGVELTLKSLVDGLKRHNVEAIYPEGEPFNPDLHQAMTMVPSADVEPNTVINVFQKGYTLNGRLVRPAMVVVSKAAE